MTDDPISRIEAALEAGPTPGPWKSSGDVTEGAGPLFVATMAYEGDERRIVARIENRESARSLDDEDFANAALIAACNPAAVRTLLDRLKAAEAENERLRDALEAVVAYRTGGLIERLCREAPENTDAR